jgi:hypothetical protein
VVGHLAANVKIPLKCMEPRLAAKRDVMVMVRAGELGCRMFDRGMFADDRIGGMHGANARGAVICQSGAVTLHSGAARTGRRAATAQSCTRT